MKFERWDGFGILLVFGGTKTPDFRSADVFFFVFFSMMVNDEKIHVLRLNDL